MSNLYDDIVMQRRKLPVLALLFGGLLIVIVLVFSQGRDINSYESCKEAGHPVLETYPEQCVFQGRTFTNTDVDPDRLIRP